MGPHGHCDPTSSPWGEVGVRGVPSRDSKEYRPRALPVEYMGEVPI